MYRGYMTFYTVFVRHGFGCDECNFIDDLTLNFSLRSSLSTDQNETP